MSIIIISGHGPSHKPSPGHPSSSTGQSLGSQWPWRDEFKTFTSRISIAVAETVKKSCDQSIEEEIQQYQNNKKLSVVYIKGYSKFNRNFNKSHFNRKDFQSHILPVALF